MPGAARDFSRSPLNSPHPDPVVARKNRITLVLLLAIIAGMLAATVVGREHIMDVMTKNKSAHGARQ